jgi:hypothetical protein
MILVSEFVFGNNNRVDATNIAVALVGHAIRNLELPKIEAIIIGKMLVYIP